MKTSEPEDKVYANVDHPLLQRVFRYPAAALVSSWAFQGLLYMDRTERWFKLGLDAILTVIGFWILNPWASTGMSLIFAFLVSHTLNFLLNGQLWGMLKGYGLVEIDPAAFELYTNGIAARARKEPAVKRLLVYGSLVRGEQSKASDLDARIIRKPGILNGFKACWFLMRERTRATFAKFPLDMYVLDSEASLAKLRKDEEAVDLLE
jgi:predicted nucleotidyltransferase